MSRKVHALMCIERDGEEIEVHVSGTAYPFRRGTKAHPMDRFAEPDEPAEIDDIAAETKTGEIELTDAELKTAEEKLWDALEEDL